jgi:acetyl esterase/lipase
MKRPSLFEVMQRLVRLRRRMRGPMRPSWDERFETWARLLHHYAKRSTILPLGVQRAMLGAAPPTPVTRRMRFEKVRAGGVQAEWFHAPESDPGRVLLYFHGGGYSIGSIDSHRDFIARLCIAAGATGLAVDYRLAPEHPFPAQLEDALAAYRWLLGRDVDPSRLVVGGESAGGGLTLSTLVSLRDAGDPLPAAAVVISPWVDLECNAPSVLANERYDYISRRALRAYAGRFVRDADLRNPLAAPLHADLRGLPPMLVQAGGAEALLDDARRIAARARDAGVDVTLDIEEDMIHVFQLFAVILERGRLAIERAGAFARKRTSALGMAATGST